MSAAPPFGFSQADFLADLRVRVPEIDGQLQTSWDVGEDGQGHVHSVTLALADLIREGARVEDRDTMRRAFDAANDALARPDADPEIVTALQVSFLEPSDIEPIRYAGALWFASPRLKPFMKGLYD